MSVRAADADVLRIAHPELRIWPAPLLERIDAALDRPRRGSWGAATPRHLASSFIRCGLCGSSIVVSGSTKRNNLSYICDRHRMHGRSACAGLGYRNEAAVDAGLLRAIAPLVDGKIARRSMALLRERLEAEAGSDGRAAARERIQRDIAASERKAKNLADAIARGGDMDPLLVAMRGETDRLETLKRASSELDSRRVARLDVRRTLEIAEKRLANLSKLLHKGGMAARPVVAAVLGSERLVATPVEVDGARRWQLTGRISAGYLMSNVVKEASALRPSCAAPRASPWRGRTRRPSP